MAKNRLGIIAALALAAFTSTPAQAGTYLFNLLNPTSGSLPSGNCSGTGVDTDCGNTLGYTQGSGNWAVNLTVSAWSIDKTPTGPDIVRNARLTSYAGSGLGIDNRGESTSSPDHSIDNDDNWVDFVVLQFDREVDLTSFQLGWVSGDSDTSVMWRTATGALPVLHNQPITTLESLLESDSNTTINNITNIPGTSSAGWRTVPDVNGSIANRLLSNLWIISAKTSDSNDYFKLKNVKVNAYPPLPEPGTWMMMIFGFGMIGGVMRRRRADAAADETLLTAS